MADKWGIQASQLIASNGIEKYEINGKWSELPSLPLESIYSFLRRDDQYNMSLVCHKWSVEFGSPSVWKTFRFHLTESQLMTETSPVMESVRKHSSMIHHVEFDFNVITYHRRLICTWCRYFIELLQTLSGNSQLISVKFRDLFQCFGVIDTQQYNDMCKAIEEFLGSQRYLKRVEFHDCSFEIIDGVSLLKILAEQNREALTHLVLRGFVLWDWNEEDAHFLEHLPKLVDFPNLTTFETGYSLIFEIMVAKQSADIQATKSFQTLALSKLILYGCEKDFVESEYDFDGLTSSDWWIMKNIYPNLQIELLDVREYYSFELLRFLIEPNMPISHLQYKNEGTEISECFDHLLECKINDHLVSLYLGWEETDEDLSSSFIPFLQACKKLKCLELLISFPANGLDLLLKSLVENPNESLEEVAIDVWHIENKNDYQSLLRSITGYAFILKLRGLNIRVNMQMTTF